MRTLLQEKNSEEKLQEFLNLMFPLFLKFISAKAVIGANFWYKQDIRFGTAAQYNQIPYVVLFKESLKISETEKSAIISICKKLGKFKGERILTHNQSVANLIIKSGYCSAKQICVSGAIRMSPFIKHCLSNSGLRSTQEEPTVSLFSFNPGLSLNGLAIPPWPKTLIKDGFASLKGSIVASPKQH